MHTDNLDSLADLFPTIPRSELASRLLCADDMQTVIEDLFAEQSQPTVYGPEVEALKGMFPSKPMNELSAALQRNGGDVEKTIDSFMVVDLPSELASLCGLTTDECRQYTARNSSLLKALADVIANHKKTTKAWTSRVQGRQASTKKPVYTFDPKSADARELNECIEGDEGLQKLNYDFLVKSLVFYEGNVPQVLSVAARFLDEKEESVTFDTKLGFTQRPVVKQAKPALALSFAQAAKSPSPGPSWQSSTNSSAKSLSMGSSSYSRSHTGPTFNYSTPEAPTIVDLHGYLVNEAVDIASRAASRWWAEELALRVEDGHLEKHARNAHFMEPLVIVTGRGLHSSGGVAKIRPAVIRKLRGLGYVLEEDSSRVIIKGKK